MHPQPRITPLLACAVCITALAANLFGQPAGQPPQAVSEDAPSHMTPELLPEDAPAPETSVARPILPPLGLSDSIGLLYDAQARLNEATRATTETARIVYEEAAGRIWEVARYMDHIARVRGAETEYEWSLLEKEGVGPGPSDTQSFENDEVVRGVEAVRFRTNRRGGVYIFHMQIRDANGEIEFYPIESLADNRMPRCPLVYLRRPTDISDIALTMRHEGPGHDSLRRMHLELGVPKRPGYARQIRFLCRRALRLIERNQPRLAREALRAAIKRLEEFQAEAFPGEANGD